MKILFIGGTGTISMAITRQLANSEHELYILNRGNRDSILPAGVRTIHADVQNEEDVSEKLSHMSFDCVCDFIGFVPAQLERDYRLFAGKTKQFIYISSASAYLKPPANYVITEGTTLSNPFWTYSQEKIACEEYLMHLYRKCGFPVTIVRPSHTYDERSVPLGVHGSKGSFQVIKRMLEGKPVIIHGDGSSLWTMTHNSDFAKGFIGLIGNPHAIGESFQITCDETMTWNHIYRTIADCLNVEFRPYYVASDFLAAVSNYDYFGSLLGDKSNSVVFDNRKLKSVVPDFNPSVRFEQGIRDTLKFVLSHPEYQVPDPEFDAWCDRVIDTLEAAKNTILGNA